MLIHTSIQNIYENYFQGKMIERSTNFIMAIQELDQNHFPELLHECVRKTVLIWSVTSVIFFLCLKSNAPFPLTLLLTIPFIIPLYSNTTNTIYRIKEAIKDHFFTKKLTSDELYELSCNQLLEQIQDLEDKINRFDTFIESMPEIKQALLENHDNVKYKILLLNHEEKLKKYANPKSLRELQAKLYLQKNNLDFFWDYRIGHLRSTPRAYQCFLRYVMSMKRQHEKTNSLEIQDKFIDSLSEALS